MVSSPSWLYQARHDASISSDQVNSWATTLETELRQAMTRYDYAKLFGDLLNEWISSGDSLALPPAPVAGSEGDEEESQSGTSVEKKSKSMRQGKPLLIHSPTDDLTIDTALPIFSRTLSTAREDPGAYLLFEARVSIRDHLLLG